MKKKKKKNWVNARCEMKKCEIGATCFTPFLITGFLRRKMEMLVSVGICVVYLLDMTNCVAAVLPSYIPMLSSNAQHESILTVRKISA